MINKKYQHTVTGEIARLINIRAKDSQIVYCMEYESGMIEEFAAEWFRKLWIMI